MKIDELKLMKIGSTILLAGGYILKFAYSMKNDDRKFNSTKELLTKVSEKIGDKES